MFNFIAKKAYKNKVLAIIYALLYVYPNGRDAITKDFPGVLTAIDQGFDQKLPEAQTAIAASTIVITEIIQTLSPDQRDSVIDGIAHMDHSKFMNWFGGIINGEVKAAPDNVPFGSLFLYAALFHAKHMKDTNEIEKGYYDYFVSEIKGTLQGLSEDERQSSRISNVLDELAQS